MFSTIICCIIKRTKLIVIVSFLLLVFHQTILSYGEVNKFIQNDDRNGLFAANKEGIISLSGYLSLHLIYVAIGRYLLIKK